MVAFLFHVTMSLEQTFYMATIVCATSAISSRQIVKTDREFVCLGYYADFCTPYRRRIPNVPVILYRPLLINKGEPLVQPRVTKESEIR